MNEPVKKLKKVEVEDCGDCLFVKNDGSGAGYCYRGGGSLWGIHLDGKEIPEGCPLKGEGMLIRLKKSKP